MKYKFELSKLAKKRFDKLPLKVRLFIAKKLEQYAENDPMVFAKKLQGYTDRYRFRAGDYRVICRKVKNKLVITLVVLKVDHRKDVYNMDS